MCVERISGAPSRPFDLGFPLAVAQNSRVRVTQVLVLVSIYEGAILGTILLSHSPLLVQFEKGGMRRALELFGQPHDQVDDALDPPTSTGAWRGFPVLAGLFELVEQGFYFALHERHGWQSRKGVQQV